MNYRKAGPIDRKLFMELWREFQKEEYELGGDILPTQFNAMQALSLFMHYVRHDYRGGVYFAEDVGVTMVGETPSGGFSFETRYPGYATVWGIYIRPEYRKKGISHGLLDYAREDLSQWFDGYFSTINPSEAAQANALNYKQTQRHTLVIRSPFPKEGSK